MKDNVPMRVFHLGDNLVVGCSVNGDDRVHIDSCAAEYDDLRDSQGMSGMEAKLITCGLSVSWCGAQVIESALVPVEKVTCDDCASEFSAALFKYENEH